MYFGVQILHISRCILPKKTTAVQNEDALSYYKVRRLYFLEVVFVATIVKRTFDRERRRLI